VSLRASRSYRAIVVLSMLSIAALLAVSHTAVANPVPINEGPEVILAVFGLLFLMNLPVNVFWYSIGVLALSRVRRLHFAVVPGFFGRVLCRKVAGAAVSITLLGALIDMSSAEFEAFWFREIGVTALVALVLVFVSVAGISSAILRLRLVPSLTVAGWMAIMNLVHWTVIATVFYGDGPAENPAPAVVAYGMICAILSMITLRTIAKVEPEPAHEQV